MATLLDLVSSRVKAELFRLLFGLNHPELHLRELVRQSGLSLGTVQQELRRLTGIGLVIRRKSGNRVYYRANLDHPLHPEVQGLVLKTDGLVNVLEPALTHEEVRLAFVFGSAGRGESKSDSDVDLMIIGKLGLRRVTQLLSGASARLAREINPFVLNPEEFADRKRRRDHFVTSVLASPKLFVKGNEHELAALGR